MILEAYKPGSKKYNPVKPTNYGISERSLINERKSLYRAIVDKESNGHIVKKQLRCTISGCFDKNNICCKACDIKKCRFKCNFLDKEECEHQRWD